MKHRNAVQGRTVVREWVVTQMLNKAAARKKFENVFIKAEDKGILPKGFSPYDFDELCRAYYTIETNGYFDTINENVAEFFRKCRYKITNWEEPQYAVEMKIGYRICV